MCFQGVVHQTCKLEFLEFSRFSIICYKAKLVSGARRSLNLQFWQFSLYTTVLKTFKNTILKILITPRNLTWPGKVRAFCKHLLKVRACKKLTENFTRFLILIRTGVFNQINSGFVIGFNFIHERWNFIRPYAALHFGKLRLELKSGSTF